MHSRAHPEPIFRVPTTRYGASLLCCRREQSWGRSNHGGTIPLDRVCASQTGLVSPPSSPGRAQDRMPGREAPQRGSSEFTDLLGVSCGTFAMQNCPGQCLYVHACLHACVRVHVCAYVCVLLLFQKSWHFLLAKH